MGIKGRDLQIDLTGINATVNKVMGIDPRRIIKIKIDITFNQRFDSKTRNILEHVALTCPVANSLHPNLKQDISFNWPQP